MSGMNDLILIVDDEPKIAKLARDYLERGGFAALRQCFTSLSPEETIQLVDRSGLRGRGGGDEELADEPLGRRLETTFQLPVDLRAQP